MFCFRLRINKINTNHIVGLYKLTVRFQADFQEFKNQTKQELLKYR